MFKKKATVSGLVLSFLNKKAGLSEAESSKLRKGKELVDQVNKNIKEGKGPVEGMSFDDKKSLFAYIIIKRENPILEKDHNPNYETAVKVLQETGDEERILEDLATQGNRLGIFSKTLVYDKDKGLSV